MLRLCGRLLSVVCLLLPVSGLQASVYPATPLKIVGPATAAPFEFNSEHQRQQRRLYQEVSANIERGRITRAKRDMAKLQDYALYPYLEYKLLMRRMTKASLADIDGFVAAYADTPLAERTRLKAMRRKTKARRWHEVLSLYRTGDSAAFQCMRLRAIYHTQGKQQALTQVEPLWLTGASRPKDCDSLFATWRQAGYQTPQLTWQRIALAMDNGKRSLARYLARSLPAAQQRDFNYWYELYRHPQRLTNQRYWRSDHPLKPVMIPIVMRRLISKKPQKAIKIWPTLEASQLLSAKKLQQLHNRLLLKLVEEQHPRHKLWLAKADLSHMSISQREQLLRAQVAHGDWPQVLALYDKLWQAPAKPPSIWQYWRARALSESGRNEVAMAIYRNLARERHYYGFLASDQLKRPYHFNQERIAPDSALQIRLSHNAGIHRAHELMRLGSLVSARREWYHSMKRFDEPERVAAAKLASEWQWHDRAIITLTMTNARDDLLVRFPTPHLAQFSTEARKHGIDPSWPLAVARQESAFMADASSSVGAMGLMQLMPDTAKRQARRSKVKYRGRHSLLQPKLNIRLGTGYLAAMLNSFDNNLAIAAAAYNAGPHRVKRWLTQELPQDRWVESIPYRETRSYVKNVLAYTVIYQNHLKHPADMPQQDVNPAVMAIFKR